MQLAVTQLIEDQHMDELHQAYEVLVGDEDLEYQEASAPMGTLEEWQDYEILCQEQMECQLDALILETVALQEQV